MSVLKDLLTEVREITNKWKAIIIQYIGSIRKNFNQDPEMNDIYFQLIQTLSASNYSNGFTIDELYDSLLQVGCITQEQHRVLTDQSLHHSEEYLEVKKFVDILVKDIICSHPGTNKMTVSLHGRLLLSKHEVLTKLRTSTIQIRWFSLGVLVFAFIVILFSTCGVSNKNRELIKINQHQTEQLQMKDSIIQDHLVKLEKQNKQLEERLISFNMLSEDNRRINGQLEEISENITYIRKRVTPKSRPRRRK